MHRPSIFGVDARTHMSAAGEMPCENVNTRYGR